MARTYLVAGSFGSSTKFQKRSGPAAGLRALQPGPNRRLAESAHPSGGVRPGTRRDRVAVTTEACNAGRSPRRSAWPAFPRLRSVLAETDPLRRWDGIPCNFEK